MSKVTSKLQVTIPKAIAVAAGIEPGSEIEFRKTADGVRIAVPGRKARAQPLTPREKLALFHAATKRQEKRNRAWRKLRLPPPKDRGWTREELYERGRPR